LEADGIRGRENAKGRRERGGRIDKSSGKEGEKSECERRRGLGRPLPENGKEIREKIWNKGKSCEKKSDGSSSRSIVRRDETERQELKEEMEQSRLMCKSKEKEEGKSKSKPDDEN
jgi:hypothetical protein